MPALGALVISVGRQGIQGTAGARGPTGPTGPTGAAGSGVPEPSANTNGRQPNSWTPVLPLNGSIMSGGINMGNVFASSATDNSRHISLWGTTYGFNATNGYINYLGGQYDFYNNSIWSMRFRTGEIHFSTDGWRLIRNSGNNDFIYYDWASNPLFGFSSGMKQFVVWSTFQVTGSFRDSGGGIYYYNICGNRFAFNAVQQYSWWLITTTVDGVVSYNIINTCDETLKQDIAPTRFDCLSAIHKIRLYKFRWQDRRSPAKPKRSSSSTQIIPIGFIAQRLQEDFPESVVEPLREGLDRNSIAVLNADPNTMLATLCGAIQQLDKEVTRREQLRAASRSND